MASRRYSLKLKISLYLILGSLFISAISLIVIQIQVFSSLKKELIGRGEAIGAAMAKNIASLIIEENIILLNQSASESAQFEAVSYVIVENDTNKILADTFNRNIPQELFKIKRRTSIGNRSIASDTLVTYSYQDAEETAYEVLSPVEEGVGGYVRIGLKKSYVDQEIQKTINFILIVIAFSFILSLIGAYLIVNSITKPILYLKESADKISMGDLSTAIKVQNNDEIGDLGHAVERMRESLSAAIDRLKKRQSMRV